MKKKSEQPRDKETPPVAGAEPSPVDAGAPPHFPPKASCEAPVTNGDDAGQTLARLQTEIADLRKVAKERDEFLKLLQRVQADFENYQKRIKRDRECQEQYKNESLLRELLPALDNLGRALKVECKSDDAKCLMSGVSLSKQEIFRLLEKDGVKEIKAKGEQFDPAYHEVVTAIESANHKDGEVIEEVATGFMLYERVIRPAKVVVAINKKPQQEETKPEAPEPPSA